MKQMPGGNRIPGRWIRYRRRPQAIHIALFSQIPNLYIFKPDRMKFLPLFLLVVLSLCCCQPGSSQRTGIPGRVELLLKDPALDGFFRISDDGISTFASVEDKAAGKVECHIYPDEYARFGALFDQMEPDSLLSLYLAKGDRRLNEMVPEALSAPDQQDVPVLSRDRPLQGMRIAIDPGHIAADMVEAEMEGKYVKMHAGRSTGFEEIAFNEANLTLATGILLRDLLVQAGAEVLLTRTAAGVNTEGISFGQWKEYGMRTAIAADLEAGRIDSARAKFLLTASDDVDLYRRAFVPDDLRKRALKINAFRPDLTLILHYNIHGPNWDNRDPDGFFQPTYANYSMAFVPGAFMEGELSFPIDRLAMLRMLLTDQLEKSTLLSGIMIAKIRKFVKVHPVRTSERLSYLENATLPTYIQGVFARNLSLTRLINSPLCYGETLCQDNRAEALRLNLKDRKVGGMMVSSRVADVAKAYYEGVLEFVKQGRQEEANHQKTAAQSP
jgi:N-acetylmuramoyl-L-alanine amidase